MRLPATEYFFVLILRVVLLCFLVYDLDLLQRFMDSGVGESFSDFFPDTPYWKYSLSQIIRSVSLDMYSLLPAPLFSLLLAVPAFAVFLFYSKQCYHFLTGRGVPIFSFVVLMLLLVAYPVFASLFSWKYGYGFPLLFLLQSILCFVRSVETLSIRHRISGMIYNIFAVWASPWLVLPSICICVAYLMHLIFSEGKHIKKWPCWFTAIEMLWLVPLLIYFMNTLEIRQAVNQSVLCGSTDAGGYTILFLLLPLFLLFFALRPFFIGRKYRTYFIFVFVAFLMTQAMWIQGN